MSFFYQLRMLIWKNLKIRKRQKTRCVVELLWPIFLFLILMWVRTRGLRSNIHECHFIQKAMPTAGGFPFLQSFLCTFNNTCYKYEKNAEEKSKFNMSRLLDLVQEINKFTSLQNATRFQNALTDINTLSKFINSINSVNTNRKENSSIKQFTQKYNKKKKQLKNLKVPLSSNSIDVLLNSEGGIHNLAKEKSKLIYRDNISLLLCNESSLKRLLNYTVPDEKFLSEMCNITIENLENVLAVLLQNENATEISKQVRNEGQQSLTMEELQNVIKLSNSIQNNINDIQSYSNALRNIVAIGEEYRNTTDSKRKNKAGYEELIQLIDYFICNRNISSSENKDEELQPGGNVTRFDSLNDQLKGQIDIVYEYDPTISKKCNNIFKIFEESPLFKTIWRIYKPFVRGKLLYTPKTNATDNIMRSMNTTFHWVEESVQFLRTASTFLSFAKMFNSDDSASMETIKKFSQLFTSSSSLNGSVNKDSLDKDKYSKNPMKNQKKVLESLQNTINEQLDLQNPLNNIKNLAYLNQILDNVTSFLECFDLDKVKGFATEEDAMVVGMELLETNKLLALIVFENQTDDTLSPFVTYKIRMNSERVDNTMFIQDGLRQAGPRMRPLIDMKYITYGFAYIQDLLEHYIIVEQTGINRSELPGIYLQQFPYPCYIDDQFVLAISRTFPLFMVLSWVYTSAMIVKSIVYEKEQRLKETMRVMGLGNFVHWVGWFIDSLVPMLLTIFLLTVILAFGKILTNAEPSLIYCFLLLYCMATIAQSFLISVFFSRANIAAASGGLIFFVLYLPYHFMVRWMLFLPTYVKAIMCLSSNVAFGLGASYFSLYEETGAGLKWEQVNKSPLYADEFSMYYVMVMLCIDFVLYLILTWYIEAVAPGQYGIPRPWYFPFKLSYWLGDKLTDKKRKTDEVNGYIAKENCEEEPKSLKVGISICNISMVYPNGKVAVNNFSLNFFEDHITSFLGHNGAGKTTTISILTGIYAPTSGTAYINGMDIRTDMDVIRNSLGMCPQHNVLFDLMSIEEHLYFYAMLRGKHKKRDVQGEINLMIDDLQLPHKRTSLARDLSGGMQRKLSVAIAFIGGSKVVILDEPTSGVDPYSRRSIWELLMKYKKGRTVVLTTHYMDEADTLGDRIAIIADGELQCCGSSLFLKNKYGRGNYLTIDMKQNENDNNDEYSSYVKALHEHVLYVVPTAVLIEQVGTELIFILPERNNANELKELFISLELNRDKLHIDSYGMSDTSLEEIFLRVADNVEPFESRTNENEVGNSSYAVRSKQFFKLNTNIERSDLVNDTQDKIHSSVPIEDDNRPLKPRDKATFKQFKALHIKRFHHSKRKLKAMFSELVLPALFVCLTQILTSILPNFGERPPLVLKPSLYGEERYIFNKIDYLNESWVQRYNDTLTGPSGLGIICSDNYSRYNNDDNDDLSCNKYAKYHDGALNISSFGPDCSCEFGSQICPSENSVPKPANIELTSREVMYDLTDSNVSDWILKTWKPHEKTRLGGYNLGLQSSVPDISGRDIIQLVSSNRSNINELNETDKFKKNNIKVWYNNKAWASSVSYLNAINNVVLKSSLPPDKSINASQYGIRAINHPMNFTKKQDEIEIIKRSGISILHAVSVLFALSFVPASFTVYIIEDRVSNSKHLQLVSGMRKYIYWIQTFTWDFSCYILSASLVVLIFVIFNEQAYISPRNFFAFVSLLFFYGFSCIPLMYPASSLFNIPSSAFVGLACANMFIGIITTLTTFVLSIFYDEELSAVNNILKKVFLISPHFCLGDGLMKLAANHYSYYELQSIDINIKNDIYSWNAVGKNLFFMFITGIIFFVITLLIEYKLLNALFCCGNSNSRIIDNFIENEDGDVKNERNRIQYGDTSQDILKIDHLTKVYNNISGINMAVNSVCFGIKKGECFGLLGLNGAGKTTTFKMLTGAIKPTDGDAYINGFSITRETSHARANIGYCPQFDALDSLLTPREHLQFYARLRNIPNNHINSVVEKCIKKLDLVQYANRCAGTLSGGNKRKLSTAIAVLGDPPLIFLDEPTSGMDPRARRFLWTCIQSLVRDGHSVILTSHSMEECQALCTKLTIMVNGTFRCLGSSQHLKSKFGEGYRLSIHCLEDNVQPLKDFMSNRLSKGVLMEEHHAYLRYQLPLESHSLPDILEAVESAKSDNLILDYSLSQTTLEDVFLQFASEQMERNSVKSKFRLKSACCLPCSRCYKGKPEN